MTSKKSGFLYAGTIVNIVLASLVFLFSVLILATFTEFIPEAMDAINRDALEEGIVYTKEELDLIEKVTKGLIYVIFTAQSLIAIGNIAIAILLLGKTARKVYSKSLTITMLILSVLLGNYLTLAFMIVVLCLKSPRQLVEEQMKVETKKF